MELLNNLKTDLALLKHGVSVNSEPHMESFFIIPVGTVIRQRSFVGVPLMFCGAG
jgi:hypothetical protein